MSALVFANGELPSQELVTELAAEASLIVAADGGANKALTAGVTPHFAVGDLDSISERSRAAMGAGRVIEQKSEDATDLEKAIAFCIEHGEREIAIIAAGGGRADHALANLSVIPLFRGRARILIVDDLFEVSLVEGEVRVEGAPGTVVSLLSIGRSRGVKTTGLRWDLDGVDLHFSPLGVHNELLGTSATVSVDEGDLLLFRGRWVERHGSPGSTADA